MSFFDFLRTKHKECNLDRYLIQAQINEISNGFMREIDRLEREIDELHIMLTNRAKQRIKDK